MTQKTIVPVRKTWGGYVAECVCGARIFRYNKTATQKAKNQHFKLEHPNRWMKGRIK